MGADLSREQSLFEAALEIADPSERQKFLNRSCANDPELKAHLEKLLDAHERSDRLFSPAVSRYAASAAPEAEALAHDPAAGDEKLGTRVGRYRLLQRLGEGGCGVVYLAEQEEPVRRKVALKVIKLGMNTRSVIARFEAERQALALMDHPNIARVLDAGATESGRPFFVMEFVQGVKITDYCDANHLDAPQRLHLFIQVCHAIQHAHQKGVIHRDIKPSNILVVVNDDVPMPMVIDFGIAKATEGKLTDNTTFTAMGQFIGTPAYMSPEQAGMSGLDVDTRSDIYSLGVLLYELLTGRTPFDQDKLLRSGFDEMRRTLREDEPQRPSVLLTSLTNTDLAATAQRRHVEPPKLISFVKGDLDWIVMKALEKDRARRYETANGLAMDVQRYLNNEPIIARPPSRIYRLQKLARRNKVSFIAGASVATALLFGFGIATWMFFKEREARQQAVVLKQEADQARHLAEVREKVTQIAFAVSQNQLEEADEESPAISDAPASLESAAVFRALGEWNALNGRYNAAADRFAVLMRVNRFDNWNTASADVLARAAVLANTGRTEEFERLRKDAVGRFASTANPVVAERLIKATLLLPTDKSFRHELEPFAKVVHLNVLQAIRFPPSSKTSSQDAQIPDSSTPPRVSGGYTQLPPVMIGASSFDGCSIGVTFSSTLDMAAATNPANYTVSGSTVTNVTPGDDARSVTLQLGSELDGSFIVSASNLGPEAPNQGVSNGTITNQVQRLALIALGDSVRQPYGASFDGIVCKTVAGGSDSSLDSDDFVFQHITVMNDFDYRLRVRSITGNLDAFARTGLMARDSLANDPSRLIMVAVNFSNTFQVRLRPSPGDARLSLPPNPLPSAFGSNSWVRLQRNGTVFYSYCSNDGENWIQLHQFDSASSSNGAFGNPLYLGIATSSHSTRQTISAVTSDFGVNPVVPVNSIVSLALLEYRNKNYAQSMEWCHLCLASRYQAAQAAMAHTVLALCLYETKRLKEGDSELGIARKILGVRFPTGLDQSSTMQGFWFDWLAAHVLFQAAERTRQDFRPAMSFH
jgi:hypothetical protein